jgi:hypothetical protein
MVQDNEGYILYPAKYPKHKIRRIHARKSHTISHHAFMYKNEASSSRHTTHVKMPRKKTPAASNEHNVSFKTFDASYVLTNKLGKVVAKYVGAITRAQRLVFGYPRCLFLTSKDPRLFGYLRTRPKIVNHMTGEKRMFSSYEKNEDPQRAITFGDGNQGLVKGLGKISISPDHSISNVFLVDSLDYNLLSVSQLCKMGYNCLFTDVGVTVFRRNDDSIAFKGVLEDQLYLVDFNENKAELNTCLIAKTNMGWIWHRRLAHVGMKNLHKLLKGEHILRLTNVHFEKDRVCIACQAGKQVGVHHPHKNIMMTDRPLELLHMDLFGPIAYIIIGRSKYCLVIVDDYSRFTWVFFLQEKSQNQETLKGFFKTGSKRVRIKDQKDKKR